MIIFSFFFGSNSQNSTIDYSKCLRSYSGGYSANFLIALECKTIKYVQEMIGQASRVKKNFFFYLLRFDSIFIIYM